MASPPDGRPVRLAILMADTPLPGTKARFGSYGGVFTDLFARAVSPAPLAAHLTITTHDVVTAELDEPAQYPALDAVDAVLITGSRHNAFADDSWIVRLTDYVRAAVTTPVDGGRYVRVVGVCFGHQILARALGSVVERSPGGWEVSVTDVELSAAGEQLFGFKSLKIHEMHRDSVPQYPPGAVALGSTPPCPIQGMLLPGRAVSVQGHPEFTADIVREILDSRHQLGMLSDQLYQSGLDRVADEHDGVAVARAFLKFMRG